ncbi:SPOR domain-containing protein [Antarctobacter sp.]|uniref:SPOR domain-containing protein n=1 Tax=Antarctobacter sp. TaxID=1872577 RepID=UPI002B268BB5|nr:SPOR domain-containing protein [Antarctobacter sp.]
MTLKTFSFFALLVSGFGISSLPVDAQSSARDVPVNFPPASYTGSQFVDNRGCVYVRAGFDGAVTWVPRVSRQRQQLCGQTPTFGTKTVAAPAAPVPTTTKPVQITTTPPVKTVAPARVQVTTTAPAPKKTVKRTVVRASKPVTAQTPRVVRRVPVAAAPVAKAPVKVVPKRVVQGGYACVNGETFRVVNGMKLRASCGPQTAPHATVIRRGEAPAPGKNVYYNKNSWEGSSLNLPPETRIVPKHVLEQHDPQVAYVPEGFSPAWKDDRLNSYRAWQTVKGHQDTQQVWTNTVPRKLVTQVRRHEVKPPVVVGHSKSPLPLTPVVTTRGHAPKAVSQPKVATGRWIEIGAFTTADKARTAAHRLQSAGLTVRMGSHKNLSLLRVGPYASHDQLKMALRRVHITGYTQAYIR